MRASFGFIAATPGGFFVAGAGEGCVKCGIGVESRKGRKVNN